MTPHELDICRWLADLSVRCTPRTAENIEVLARDYATDLTDLPREVFCEACRHAASLKFDHFPAFRSLRKFLEEWQDKNLTPAATLLPLVNDPDLSDEDRAHVRSWINRRASGDLERRLAFYHDRFEHAFRYIVRTDAEAEAIARRRGWIGDTAIDVSEVGIARNLIQLEQTAIESPVGAALASFGLSILRRNVERTAPERVHLLPDRITPQRERRRSVGQQLAALGGSGIEQAKEAVADAWLSRRTMADDRAELAMLEKTPSLPNRDQRIASLRAKLTPPTERLSGGEP